MLSRNKAEVFEILSSLPEEVFASLTSGGQESEVKIAKSASTTAAVSSLLTGLGLAVLTAALM